MNTLKLTLFLVFLPIVGLYAEATYFKTTAKPGDGIYSLLRRHQLDGHRCNFDKFYGLNNLDKNAGLKAGREYLLPIEVHAFDGRSIRTTIDITDWDTAVSIRDYNHSLVETGILSGNYDETKILWVPFHLVNCPDNTVNIPSPVSTEPEQGTTSQAETPSTDQATSGRRVFPIFGDAYAYTPLASTSLRGKVFYVVAGHGGPDPGAIGTRGGHTLCEDEYAYDVALRLCRNLIAHGATAYMINRDVNDGIRDDEFLDCDNDEVVWGDISQSRNQKTRLTQRSDVVNDLYEKHRLQGVTEQTMVVVHIDSRNRGQRTDVFFYHHPNSNPSKQIALRMQSTMRQKYRRFRANGEYRGTVTGRDLHMLRECTPNSVYVELGNIRNPNDQQRIIIKRNRELIAEWLLEGLMQR